MICASVSLAVASVACGGSQPPGSSGTPASSPDYEVHEWGLVRGAPGDLAEASSTPAARPIDESLSDKPMLYFHSERPFELRSVVVTPTDGTVREHWPLVTTDVSPTSVRWTGLRIAPGPCAPRPLPSLREPPCAAAVDAFGCEAPTLAVARSASALCIRSSAAEESFLFYRSTSRSFRPPLRVAPAAGGGVAITLEGSSPVPGSLVSIRRGASGVSAAIVSPPTPAAPVTIRPEDERISGRDAREATAATMSAIGLDRAEIDAFMRAWSATLFDLAPPDRDVVVVDDERVADRMSVDGTPAGRPNHALLYFLAAGDADRVSRLSFDPEPRRVVRAMAVFQPVP